MLLLTGANGFLGRNLIEELNRRNYQIRAFVGPGENLYDFYDKVAEVRRGDILDREVLQEAARGCWGIIHAAGHTSIWPPRNALQRLINIEGTANMIEAARKAGVKRVVHVSSAIAFGYGSKERPGDETREYRAGCYGLDYFDSKHEAQLLVLQAAARGDLPAVIVNPTYMFGPYDAKPSSGALILAVYHQQLPAGGTGGRNYASVKDVAVGIVNALEMGSIGECYILGNQNLCYKELFEKISEVTGKPASKTTCPIWLGKIVGLGGSIYGRVFSVVPPLSLAMVKLAISEHYYTAKKAVESIGLPQTPIETAIEEALRWFRDSGYLDLEFLRTRLLHRRPSKMHPGLRIRRQRDVVIE
jgi:dihydroflavonol-4-reductase